MAVVSTSSSIVSETSSGREGSTITSSLVEEPARQRNTSNYNTLVADASAKSTSPASGVLMSRDVERGQATEPTRHFSCSCYRQRASFTEHVIYFCALAVASYAGVVIRIYLAKLAQWNGVPLFPSLSAEVVGTAIMGFIGAHKGLLADNHKPVYQAIATGLCGSITTFSSWNSEAVEILLQVDHEEHPDNATRIIGWASTLILGVGMSIAALLFGRHLAHLSPRSDVRTTGENVREIHTSSKFFVKLEGALFVIAWSLLTCLIPILCYFLFRFELLFSIIFASIGTYVRWHLAPLNSLFKHFKLGTFLVNVGGSWILGATLVARKHLFSRLGEGHVGLLVLSGMATGFCGCLTTVSTFAVELTSLSLVWSYVYAFSSILSAQLGLVVIRGVYQWTV